MRSSAENALLFVAFAVSTIIVIPGPGLLAQADGGSRFTRADTLRGMLTPERSCYDVRWYHLDVRIDPDSHSVRGSTTIRFTTVSVSNRIQVDLFPSMSVFDVSMDSKGPLSFTREEGAVFITMPSPLVPGSTHTLIIRYGGEPQVAVRPPWDGGFIWAKGDSGAPWVAVACQGTGASLWWPNKDHQSDEPDSMLISVTVPPGLEDVSNGRLRTTETLPDGWRRFAWAVTSPINNYNVTVNVGKFAHFAELSPGSDSLTFDYYVLPSHLDQAREQFQQVQPMMRCFESWFGPYPFRRDGYKIVESPHLGMEHQSAIAYGNEFRQGYRGYSSSRYGLLFDFIIVHESSHEWWGNNVTSKDIADMWIHESFGAYAEALYVECRFGGDAMLDYINAKKMGVRNDRPIIGPYDVNKEGSGDMYPKGALMLHTIRFMIDSDSLWRSILQGFQSTFGGTTVTTGDIVKYFNERSGKNLTPVFDEYLRHAKPPELVVNLLSRNDSLTVRYRWKADETDFAVPVKVTGEKGTWITVTPTAKWNSISLGKVDPTDFRVDDRFFYGTVSKRIIFSTVNSVPGPF
jgi:aminopeptidase N